jgi:hypothetical protein
MERVDYWRLRYLVADAQRIEQEAKWTVARAMARLHDELRAVGLDPSRAYTFDDSAERIVEAETPHHGSTPTDD